MRKILIVDDERNVRLGFKICLEAEGYDVLEVSDGQSALPVIKNDSPDVVLLDLRMPGMDGLSVLQSLSALGPTRPPVIVLTAYGTVNDAKRAMQLGAYDFLEKPITSEALRQAVADAMKANVPIVEPSQSVKDIMTAAREALANHDLSTAERLLVQAHDLHEGDPNYLNLVGAVHELNHRWEEAHRYYGKAVHRKSSVGQLNLRRLYELEQFGKSEIPMQLGAGLEIPLAGQNSGAPTHG